MILRFSQPLDLVTTLQSGQVFRWRLSDGWFYGVLAGAAVRLRQLGPDLEFSTSGDEGAMVALLRDYFREDDDLERVYQSIATDPSMADAIARYRGLRLLRQDPWECLFAFICSAWSNIPRISRHLEEISARFGAQVELNGHELHAFPTADALAGVGADAFRSMGLGFRARYLAAAAQMVSERAVDLGSLRPAPYAEALGVIRQIPGVGSKVGECVLAFSLDKLEAFPVDVWVRRALLEWYFEGGRATDLVLRTWAQKRFGAYAAYAQQYLYHHRRLLA